MSKGRPTATHDTSMAQVRRSYGAMPLKIRAASVRTRRMRNSAASRRPLPASMSPPDFRWASSNRPVAPPPPLAAAAHGVGDVAGAGVLLGGVHRQDGVHHADAPQDHRQAKREDRENGEGDRQRRQKP